MRLLAEVILVCLCAVGWYRYLQAVVAVVEAARVIRDLMTDIPVPLTYEAEKKEMLRQIGEMLKQWGP